MNTRLSPFTYLKNLKDYPRSAGWDPPYILKDHTSLLCDCQMIYLINFLFWTLELFSLSIFRNNILVDTLGVNICLYVYDSVCVF